MLHGAEREAAGMSGDPRQRPLLLLLLGWAPRQRGEGAVTILAPPGGASSLPVPAKGGHVSSPLAGEKEIL